jgi:hypothetical protein
MSVRSKSKSENPVFRHKNRKGGVQLSPSQQGSELAPLRVMPFFHNIAVSLTAVVVLLFITVSPCLALTSDIPSEDPDVSRYEGFTDPPFTQDDVKRQHGREKQKVRLEIADGRRHFVGDEPLTLQYLVFFPFGTRLLRESISRNLAPFEVISLQIGSRMSVMTEKNMEAVPITFTIRLPQKHPVGSYTLPGISVSLSFEHFAVAGQQKEKITVTSESIQLEKVPLYVDIVQRNNQGAIGDALPFVIEIYAGKDSVILNEYPPETPVKGVMYLSEYEPAPPVVLLKRHRSEFVAESYRVVKWTYIVALHDLNEEGEVVELPPVIWTAQSAEISSPGKKPGNESASGSSDNLHVNRSFEAEEKLKIIQPDPITLKSYGLIGSDRTFRPLKGPLGIKDSERFLLYKLPLSIFWLALVLTLLWIVNCIVQFLHRAKQKQIGSGTADTSEPPRLFYDHSAFHRWKLSKLVDRARRAYHEKPSQETCSHYQKVLVRILIARLPKARRISIQESYAMTTVELADLIGERKEIAELRLLEEQLAADKYDSPENIQNKSFE